MDAMYKLLPLIRVNAVALVDAFDLLDSNLCKYFLMTCFDKN